MLIVRNLFRGGAAALIVHNLFRGGATASREIVIFAESANKSGLQCMAVNGRCTSGSFKSSSPMVRGEMCSPNHRFLHNAANSGEASFVREL